jgi:hypothetical protein
MAEVGGGNLEVGEDLAFQRWQWRAAQILWAALLAVMAATVLGVFGGGPLSRARAGDAGAPLFVDYERLARFGASMRLVVHARPQPDGDIRFTIDRSILDAFVILHVTPPPASTVVAGSGVEYRFRTGTNGPAAVIVEVQPATRWGVEGAIASPDASVRLRSFIFP